MYKCRSYIKSSTINPSARRYLGVASGAVAVGRKLVDVGARPELLDVVNELAALFLVKELNGSFTEKATPRFEALFGESDSAATGEDQ